MQALNEIMPSRGYCIILIPINVLSKTTTILLPLKNTTTFYFRNASCGRMVLVGSLGSDLMPECVFLKKNKIN
jgi:hypothetical protein